MSDQTARHMDTVLKYPDGRPVSYTDGLGLVGSGVWLDGGVQRGSERAGERRVPAVTLAVAPPKSKDRQRFIVEKAQELGVERLVWLTTDHAQGRPVATKRSAAWTVAALEQSRGAWLMAVEESVALGYLNNPILLHADAPESLATMDLPDSVTLAIGPEGGFTDRELESANQMASLPTNILRT
ncbi:MAG: RsmE family RNA methyltransferase, partial [Actinomycetota bacterium]